MFKNQSLEYQNVQHPVLKFLAALLVIAGAIISVVMTAIIMVAGFVGYALMWTTIGILFVATSPAWLATDQLLKRSGRAGFAYHDGDGWSFEFSKNSFRKFD